MVTRFKSFTADVRNRLDAFRKLENFLHHIAEEELNSCKVFNIEAESTGKYLVLNFIADCNDVIRAEGLQYDLSDKLMTRLKMHDLSDIGRFKVKVIHKNIDPR